MITPYRIPIISDTQIVVGDIEFESISAHNEMTSLFTRSNLLYNMSSSTEDIISSRFMSIYSLAKSILNGNFTSLNYMIENFNSQSYIDTVFPVDNLLSIDMANGIMSLPISATNTLDISAIIIESDSTGLPGNSLNNFANADISAVLNSNSSSMFEYEKIVNTYSSTELYLSMTLKLSELSICNAAQFKLFVDPGTSYPSIDMIETSEDGTSWYAISYSSEIGSDYFIKFNPRRIRYMRVRFKQSTYTYITTPFGAKYRYLIGIRQLTLSSIQYKSSGDYVSIPFSSKKSINSVVMTWTDSSIGDIEYFISANNGGKWLKLLNNIPLDIVNQDAGLRGDIDVEAVRVKISMLRTSSPTSAVATEYLQCNADNSYYLKNAPVSVTPYLGYHISRGDSQIYEATVQAISATDGVAISTIPLCTTSARSRTTLFYVPYTDTLEKDLVVKLNGTTLVDDGSIWAIISHPNPAHSILLLDVDKIPSIKDNAMSNKLGINYKPYVHSHLLDTHIIQLPQPSIVDTKDGFTIQLIDFIPEPIDQTKTFSEGIVIADGHDAIFAVDNDTSTYWRAPTKDDTGDWSISFETPDFIELESYMITPFVDMVDDKSTLDYNPGIWELHVKPPVGDWIKVDSKNLINAKDSWIPGVGKEFRISLNCKYKQFRLVIKQNSEVLDVLKQKVCGLTNINLNSRSSKTITEFVVIDRNTLQILPADYNSSADYEVSYYPSVDISPSITLPISGNAIQMNGLNQASQNAKICFRYNYLDAGALTEITYYTPFCNDYRITFS